MNFPVWRIRLHKWTIFVMLFTTALAISVIVILEVFPREQIAQQSLAGSPNDSGRLAPDFMLPALDGTEVSLSQLSGQPVLINFWASWCIPCRDEMPELVRVYESHKAEGLMILGVNLTYSDSVHSVQAFANEFNITFPVLLDEEASVAGKIYQIPGLPTSVFVTQDGTIERIQVGVMSGRQVDEYVAEILR